MGIKRTIIAVILAVILFAAAIGAVVYFGNLSKKETQNTTDSTSQTGATNPQKTGVAAQKQDEVPVSRNDGAYKIDVATKKMEKINNDMDLLTFAGLPKETDSVANSISIMSQDGNQDKMFYPDWIVKTNKGILILETKAGDTATSENTKYKAEALQEWLKEQKTKIYGGIVASDAGVWKINKNAKYQYSDDFKGWDLLDKYL